MNFTLKVPFPLHMLYTRFGRNWRNTLREESQNVQMLKYDGRRRKKTDNNRLPESLTDLKWVFQIHVFIIYFPNIYIYSEKVRH